MTSENRFLILNNCSTAMFSDYQICNEENRNSPQGIVQDN